jgi:hypothetical protein
VIVILCVVALLLHKYELAKLAESVTESPWQKVVGPLAVITADGSGFTLTAVIFDLAEHPLLSVTVTE